jgi:hypothetical protein
MSKLDQAKRRNHNVLKSFKQLDPCLFKHYHLVGIQPKERKDYNQSNRKSLNVLCLLVNSSHIKFNFSNVTRYTYKPNSEHHQCYLVKLVLVEFVVVIDFENEGVVY